MDNSQSDGPSTLSRPVAKKARTKKIDAHQHFWQYNAQEYGWIDDSMRLLRRAFMPEDLAALMKETGISGSVVVQARQSLTETNWLLDLAEANRTILGVVGWVPLADPALAEMLSELTERKKFKGVRHVIHDEADDQFILGKEFGKGIAKLREHNLTYDLLIFERHLPQTIQFVDRHPNQVFILDHVAKPRIRETMIQPWRDNLAKLAKRKNVYCKLSGMATEANWDTWSKQQLRPYLETVVNAFGPERLMFGSDWPVCLVAVGYRRWVELVNEFTDELSDDEKARIFGGTAIEAYGL